VPVLLHPPFLGPLLRLHLIIDLAVEVEQERGLVCEPRVPQDLLGQLHLILQHINVFSFALVDGVFHFQLHLHVVFEVEEVSFAVVELPLQTPDHPVLGDLLLLKLLHVLPLRQLRLAPRLHQQYVRLVQLLYPVRNHRIQVFSLLLKVVDSIFILHLLLHP